MMELSVDWLFTSHSFQQVLSKIQVLIGLVFANLMVYLAFILQTSNNCLVEMGSGFASWHQLCSPSHPNQLIDSSVEILLELLPVGLGIFDRT